MNFKKLSKWISFTLVLTLVISLLIPTGGHVQAAEIKLNKSTLSINAGKTYTLKLQNASGTIKWTSSDKSVLTVSKGKITAKKAGKANVTATYKGKSYKCAVAVKGKTVKVLYRAVILDESSIDDYVKQVQDSNPEYISVKAYNNEYIEVTMYDSKRLSDLKLMTNELLSDPESLITEYATFTKIKTDKLLKKVTLYADPENNEGSLDYVNVTLMLIVISDYIQALNLVDIEDRGCDIKILDNKTGEVLYP
jgi:hypothetical protein